MDQLQPLPIIEIYTSLIHILSIVHLQHTMYKQLSLTGMLVYDLIKSLHMAEKRSTVLSSLVFRYYIVQFNQKWISNITRRREESNSSSKHYLWSTKLRSSDYQQLLISMIICGTIMVRLFTMWHLINLANISPFLLICIQFTSYNGHVHLHTDIENTILYNTCMSPSLQATQQHSAIHFSYTQLFRKTPPQNNHNDKNHSYYYTNSVCQHCYSSNSCRTMLS